MNNIFILAQAEGDQTPLGIRGEELTQEYETTAITQADANGMGPATKPPRSPLMQFLPVVLIFVLMYLILFRGPRKKQQKHKQMVQSLAKNDKIRTIGGIIGTVVDIRDDEITLKVDESNNTKIKIAFTAVGKNLSKENN